MGHLDTLNIFLLAKSLGSKTLFTDWRFVYTESLLNECLQCNTINPIKSISLIGKIHQYNLQILKMPMLVTLLGLFSLQCHIFI